MYVSGDPSFAASIFVEKFNEILSIATMSENAHVRNIIPFENIWLGLTVK